MKIKMIALTDLVPSTANVRKTGAGIGIQELAASIEAHGLLQNLQVRETTGGKFEVVAGGRRLAALKVLAKRKALPKDAPIGCNVLDFGRCDRDQPCRKRNASGDAPRRPVRGFQGADRRGAGA